MVAGTRLAFIRDAQSAGLTLAEILSVLVVRDSGQAPCAHVTDLILQHLTDIERRMAELHKARTALRGLAGRAAVPDPGSCTDADICSIIGSPAARQPGSPAARQPGSPAARQPGSPAARQPGSPATN